MSTNLILTAIAGGTTFMLSPKETRVRDAAIAMGISYAAGALLMREPQPTDLMPPPNPSELQSLNPTISSVEQSIAPNIGPSQTFSVPASTIQPSTSVPSINQVILSNPTIADAPNGPTPDRMVPALSGPIDSAILDPAPSISIPAPAATIAPDTERKTPGLWQAIANLTAPEQPRAPSVPSVSPWSDFPTTLPIRRSPGWGRIVEPNPVATTVPSVSGNAATF